MNPMISHNLIKDVTDKFFLLYTPQAFISKPYFLTSSLLLNGKKWHIKMELPEIPRWRLEGGSRKHAF
jgi:hypothetical protein